MPAAIRHHDSCTRFTSRAARLRVSLRCLRLVPSWDASHALHVDGHLHDLATTPEDDSPERAHVRVVAPARERDVLVARHAPVRRIEVDVAELRTPHRDP